MMRFETNVTGRVPMSQSRLRVFDEQKKKKKRRKKKKNEQEKEFHDFNSTQIEVNIKTRLIDYSFYSRVSFIY